MKRTMLTLLALLLVPHLVYSEEKTDKRTEAIPKEHANKRAICLPLDSRSKNDDYHTINVRLINPTSTPITFTGYSESSPWYKIQKWENGKWVGHNVGWFCGTGLRQCVIPSARSSVIPVHVQADLFPIRVGVEYARGKKREQEIVWSARIEEESSNK